MIEVAAGLESDRRDRIRSWRIRIQHRQQRDRLAAFVYLSRDLEGDDSTIGKAANIIWSLRLDRADQFDASGGDCFGTGFGSSQNFVGRKIQSIERLFWPQVTG